MKKLLTPLMVLIIVPLLFVYTSCPDLSDECDKEEMPHISKTFLPSVVIKYKDGNYFTGKVDYFIVKERCDESQSGYFTTTGSPDGTGKYTPPLEPIYSLNNKKDRVFFQFTAFHTPFYPAVLTEETAAASFNYDKAIAESDEYDEIIKTYYITIPTNSDGTK